MFAITKKHPLENKFSFKSYAVSLFHRFEDAVRTGSSGYTPHYKKEMPEESLEKPSLDQVPQKDKFSDLEKPTFLRQKENTSQEKEVPVKAPSEHKKVSTKLTFMKKMEAKLKTVATDAYLNLHPYKKAEIESQKILEKNEVILKARQAELEKEEKFKTYEEHPSLREKEHDVEETLELTNDVNENPVLEDEPLLSTEELDALSEVSRLDISEVENFVPENSVYLENENLYDFTYNLSGFSPENILEETVNETAEQENDLSEELDLEDGFSDDVEAKLYEEEMLRRELMRSGELESDLEQPMQKVERSEDFADISLFVSGLEDLRTKGHVSPEIEDELYWRRIDRNMRDLDENLIDVDAFAQKLYALRQENKALNVDEEMPTLEEATRLFEEEKNEILSSREAQRMDQDVLPTLERDLELKR